MFLVRARVFFRKTNKYPRMLMVQACLSLDVVHIRNGIYWYTDWGYVKLFDVPQNKKIIAK